MRKITESEMFPEIDALPSDWSFLIKPKQETEIPKIVQIRVKCEEETKELTLYPSTLDGEYSLIQLNRLIITNFNLSKNSSIDLFCHRTKIGINTDSKLLKAIKDSSFLQIDVLMRKQEDPCLLCLSFECCHTSSQTIRRSINKKRKVDVHNTLIPDFNDEKRQTQIQEEFTTSPIKTKKRRFTLTNSRSKIPKNDSLSLIESSATSFFPFEVCSF